MSGARRAQGAGRARRAGRAGRRAAVNTERRATPRPERGGQTPPSARKEPPRARPLLQRRRVRPRGRRPLERPRELLTPGGAAARTARPGANFPAASALGAGGAPELAAATAAAGPVHRQLPLPGASAFGRECPEPQLQAVRRARRGRGGGWAAPRRLRRKREGDVAPGRPSPCPLRASFLDLVCWRMDVRLRLLAVSSQLIHLPHISRDSVLAVNGRRLNRRWVRSPPAGHG